MQTIVLLTVRKPRGSIYRHGDERPHAVISGYQGPAGDLGPIPPAWGTSPGHGRRRPRSRVLRLDAGSRMASAGHSVGACDMRACAREASAGEGRRAVAGSYGTPHPGWGDMPRARVPARHPISTGPGAGRGDGQTGATRRGSAGRSGWSGRWSRARREEWARTRPPSEPKRSIEERPRAVRFMSETRRGSSVGLPRCQYPIRAGLRSAI
jgi:hypothetical protein